MKKIHFFLLLFLPLAALRGQCNASTAQPINEAFQDLQTNPEIELADTRTYCVITNAEVFGTTLPVAGEVELTSGNSPYPFSISIERISDGNTQVLDAAGEMAVVTGNTVYEVTITGDNLGDADVTFTITNFGGIPPQVATLSVVPVVLPVTWSSPLSARPDGKTVDLEWAVIDQLEVAGYALESTTTTNGVWGEVAQIPVQESTGEIYYHASDLIGHTTTYYRIRQWDYDGAESYSNVVEVAAATGQDIRIFPNPVMNELQIRPKGMKGPAKIYNRWGSLMREIELDGHPTSLRVDGLPPGMYLILMPDEKTVVHFVVGSK